MEGGKGLGIAALIVVTELVFLLLFGFIMTFIFRRKRKLWAFVPAALCIAGLLFFYFFYQSVYFRQLAQFHFVIAFLLLFLLVQPIFRNDISRLWLRSFFEGLCFMFMLRGIGLFLSETHLAYTLVSTRPYYFLSWINLINPVIIIVLLRYVKYYPQSKWKPLLLNGGLLGLALGVAPILLIQIENVMAGVFAHGESYATVGLNLKYILLSIIIPVAYSLVTITVAKWLYDRREGRLE